MGLLGALFGGTVGFMVGGPLGAMIGGAIGAQTGGATVQTGGRVGAGAQRPGMGYQTGQDAQSAFLVAVISLAAKVAKADGKVTELEVKAFDSFLRDNLRMPPEERRMAGRIFNQARDSSVPAGAFARQVRGLLGGQPDRLRDIVTVLLQIAHADGRLDQAEEHMIRGIARDMGLTDADYENCKAFFGANGSAGGSRGADGRPTRAAAAHVDYEVLGVAENASEQEIKKAYRRIAREYHPDVLQSKGLPEDFMEFAKQKLQRVNESYDRIKKERGF